MRVVTLVSGSGTNFQAVLDAAGAGRLPGVEIVAVGSDLPDTAGVARGVDFGAEGFVVRPRDFGTRAEWDRALAEKVASYEPDLVVASGFMRILGAAFLDRFGGRTLNTHPALLPSFPGAHGVRDAMAHGVKVTGCTIHWVDAGVDTGPIIDQTPVRIESGESQDHLHERIKVEERKLLVNTIAALANGSMAFPG